MRMIRFILALIGLGGLLAACQAQPEPGLKAGELTGPAAQTPGQQPGKPLSPETEAPAAAQHSLYFPRVMKGAEAQGSGVFISPGLPAELGANLKLPAGYQIAVRPEPNSLTLAVNPDNVLGRWVYALVTPFASLVDGVKTAEIQEAWQGQASGPFGGQPILIDAESLAVLSALWGKPAGEAVRVLAADEILDYAWEHRPAWAIVPFQSIRPRWKVLEVDGISPLRKEFDAAAYSLAVPIGVEGDPARVKPFLEALRLADSGRVSAASNRDPGKLTTLDMTGVTALVRATAYLMEIKGIKYPAQDIGEILRSADLTHISNEVPFAKDCPFPDPNQESMRFCSSERYIALLEDVGTDIVELSGDHFQDWGTAAVTNTLNLYKSLGWGYYGGGENLADGRKALLVENNGNKLAFIGCNAKGPAFAHASASNPGAVTCDFEWMTHEIARLRQAGYLVIATFQHKEYYTYLAQPDQIADFGRLAQAGAVIVSGSQAHQPQSMAFAAGPGADAFIHYGLGNLFFDQYLLGEATRQAFIDRQVFYNGQYLGVELLPIIFVDNARARPMNAAESRDLLQTVFSASGW